VLHDVRCAFPAGRLTAVVGPNGSGKSTLVAHLAGIRRPPRGVVDVLGHDGHDLARRPQPDLVGFVFQNPEHQFLTHRVFDEVAWGLRRARLPEPEVRARTEGELARLGLAHLAGASPYKLSGGEKRRLSLATALVLRPRLLVMDEPTFGQDANTTDALLDRLHHLLAGGTTVVVVTHDVHLLATHADHTLLLVGGRVAYQGPPGPLLNDDALLEAGHLLRPPLLDLARRLAPATPPDPALAALAAWLPPAAAPVAPPVRSGVGG
jgi:energy-coupling factor transporter ATP-binding protein EcfA2